MNNLILVDGVSGVWKEDFRAYIYERLANTVIIKKYSDRPLRDGEDKEKLDLHLLSSDSFQEIKFDYEYVFNGHRYGILKEEIMKMRAKRNIFIIVRNHDIICELKKDFSDIFNVVTCFVYVGLELILPKYDSWYGEEGKRNIREALIDYYRYPESYERILIYSESRSDFYRLLDNVVSTKSDIVDDFVFIVMSMADLSGRKDRKTKFVGNLYKTIKDSFSYYNLRALRVDAPETAHVIQATQNTAFNIIDNKILDCIQKAKLVVVDLSFPRPNCYFELGYALALNKKVILVASRKSEIHFDLEHHNIFKYNNLTELQRFLKNSASSIQNN